ncbi:di-heme oxidoredictase family protein [Roseateles sp. L2-2]|uniref:di-heme oxidoreductase family protein n=1 Tax=Roseateles sp. L2-2 TaxID=3422597 RepID=UPI003D35B49B
MMGKAFVRALLGSALLTACVGGGNGFSGQHGSSLRFAAGHGTGDDTAVGTDIGPDDTTTTSPFLLAAEGATPTPLFEPQSPIETLQFTLPDGTLVTRFGNRAVGRHGRERGEEWNEAGQGPNETVDEAGKPVDKGRGAYLGFVPNSFRNRTWGLEIVDDSRVPGVTRPTLKVNTYNPSVDFLPGGTAFFRAFDRVGVTGYGWMDNGTLLDGTGSVCKPVGYPAGGKSGVDHCTVVVKEYPGHVGLGQDGFPDGSVVGARALKIGDPVEVAPSMFSTLTSMRGRGDAGGIRYFAGEWLYVVGQGLTPWHGVQPRLNSAPLPESTLSGGLGSVSYNYSDEGFRMFQQPVGNIGMQDMQRFVDGRRTAHSSFVTGAHDEAGNDPMPAVADLAGKRFNAASCVQCHTNNGRSPAPFMVDQRLEGMAFHVAVRGDDGRIRPDPRYGSAILMNAASASGATQDGGNAVKVAGFETRAVTLADGTTVELRKAKFAFAGPTPELWSARAAQPLIGVGLLEAVPEEDILARVRTKPDADGVRGRANFSVDPETGATRLGRFGWKAGKSSLRHQVAAALLNDMSVTSSVFPNRSCAMDPAGCRTAPPQTGIAETDLVALTQYMQLLAVPAQRSLASGFPKGVAPMEEHRVDPVQVAAGRKVFDALRCAACHTAEMKTGSHHPFAELRDQTIRPFTDLLLHDMGPGLADSLPEGRAPGRMWRTSALWGIGYTEKVAQWTPVGYLHDGRARNLTEAILWHGGEAEKSRQRFEKLSTAEREALLAWLRSL